jgi:hypothetical protein
MKNTFSILIVIVFWTSCSHADKTGPKRIKGIPESAFWVGGQDRGQWYKIKEIDSESLIADIIDLQ